MKTTYECASREAECSITMRASLEGISKLVLKICSTAFRRNLLSFRLKRLKRLKPVLRTGVLKGPLARKSTCRVFDSIHDFSLSDRIESKIGKGLQRDSTISLASERDE